MRRVPQKRDAIEADVVEALKRLGWSVAKWSALNCPDLVIGRHGVTHLVEVKSGKAPLKPGQIDWHREWRGSPVIVLRSVDDALALSNQNTLGVDR